MYSTRVGITWFAYSGAAFLPKNSSNYVGALFFLDNVGASTSNIVIFCFTSCRNRSKLLSAFIFVCVETICFVIVWASVAHTSSICRDILRLSLCLRRKISQPIKIVKCSHLRLNTKNSHLRFWIFVFDWSPAPQFFQFLVVLAYTCQGTYPYGPLNPTEQSKCCKFAATIFFVLAILFFIGDFLKIWVTFRWKLD